MEALLCRNNASMGSDRIRYSWRASTTAILGAIGAREKSSHRLHYKYQRAAATILANEIASGRFQLFDCHFTRRIGRCRCSGSCIISNVTAGCAYRATRLRCDDIECHFIHHSYGSQHQFMFNFFLQLGLHIVGRMFDWIWDFAYANRVRWLADTQNLSAAVRQLLRLDILHCIFQGEIYRFPGTLQSILSVSTGRGNSK